MFPKKFKSMLVPNDKFSSRRQLDDADRLATLERCFSLLQGIRLHTASLPTGTLASHYQTPAMVTLSKFLRREPFDRVKKRVTRKDHDLFDIIWPGVKKLPEERGVISCFEEDFIGGVLIPDFDTYEVYPEFLWQFLKHLHRQNLKFDLPKQPETYFNENKGLSDLRLDAQGKILISSVIEVSRNLDYYELPVNLTVKQLEDVEQVLTQLLLSRAFDEGIYYTMNEILERPSEIRAKLTSLGLLIPICEVSTGADGDSLQERLYGKNWPYGRGVFVNQAHDTAIWINVLDHIRVVTCAPSVDPDKIGLAYAKMAEVTRSLEEYLIFKRHPVLGWLSARPFCIGNGLKFTVIAHLPQLTKEPENLKHMCHVRGIYSRTSKLNHDIVRMSNLQSLSVTEDQCFRDFATAVMNILVLEKEMVSQNTLHIARSFLNLFRRKTTMNG